VIALANGNEINYERLASDCQVSPNTLKNYIQILDDTLLGFSLPGYTKSKKRKAIFRSKYYLFDLGVTNFLANRSRIKDRSKEFGDAFEHFIILEMRAFISYYRKKCKMRYWRSTSKFEVDLLIDDYMAIEIKSAELIQNRQMKGLRALMQEGIFERYIIVSKDESKRITEDGVEIYPWKIFLKELWSNKLFSIPIFPANTPLPSP